MKDPAEVQPPGGDCFLIVLRMEKPRDRVPFTILFDVPLDLGHGPMIESLVSGLHDMSIAGPTHVVNCSIASNTD